MKAVKTLLLVAVFGFVATAASAQISAGTMFIGGDASFGSSTFEETAGDESKVTTGLFGPRFGYFIGDNLAIGVGVQLGGTKVETGVIEFPFFGSGFVDEGQINEFAVRPFARYYNMFNDNFGLFGELGVLYNSTTYEVDGTELLESSAFGADVALGFAFFPSTRFAIEGSVGLLGFASTTFDDSVTGDEIGTDSSFEVGGGNNAITLSAVWYFNR